MQKGVLVLLLFFSSAAIMAQDKFFTKSGKVAFYSKAPIEDIEAHNKSVTCVLDSKTGNIQFMVLIKGFEFVKALMQEHFNEDYLESDKFPKSEFKGQLVNNNVDYTKNGDYPVKVKGQLSLHGATKEITADGKIIVNGDKITISAEFFILLAEYNIKNDRLNNISNKIRVVVDCSLEPLKR